jgi:hypothetical protein
MGVLLLAKCDYSSINTRDLAYLFLNKIYTVSWKSRVIGFGHAEQDIGDADRAEYR